MSVRTLVVDDSPTMRALVASLLNRDPEIEIIGTADCPSKARTMIRELDPDVITLDVEMPEMDGLSFLEKIMRLRPTPVVMVSGYTQSGAEATVRALELGAFDCYAKPQGGMGDLLARDDGKLAEMVKQAASTRHRLQPRHAGVRPTQQFSWNGKLVAIAASTGGVEAIGTLLESFPDNAPPTVIVQHMPAHFTRSFATRLDGRVAPRVVEAEDGMQLQQGTVYIAPGGDHHLAVRGSNPYYCRLIAGDPVNGHRPSGDILFQSVAQAMRDHSVGVILTGMGDDGARGLLKLREIGATTLGQNEATSLIYGMPRAAAKFGAVTEPLALDRIAQRILQLCSR